MLVCQQNRTVHIVKTGGPISMQRARERNWKMKTLCDYNKRRMTHGWHSHLYLLTWRRIEGRLKTDKGSAHQPKNTNQTFGFFSGSFYRRRIYVRESSNNERKKNIKKEQDDHEIEFNNDIKNKVPQKPQHKHQQRQRYDTHTEKWQNSTHSLSHTHTRYNRTRSRCALLKSLDSKRNSQPKNIPTCFKYNVNFYDPLKTLHILSVLRLNAERQI